MREIAAYWWITAALGVLLLLAGCPDSAKRQQEEQQAAEEEARKLAIELASSKTPKDIGQHRLGIRYDSARPPRGSSVVELDFALECAGAEQAFTVDNPNDPPSRDIAVGEWRVKVTPRLGEGDTSNQRLKTAFLRGTYCLDVYAPSGKRAGHFDISDASIMHYKGQSEIGGLRTELISTNNRSLFMLWPAAAANEEPRPMAALEWERGFTNDFEVSAGDGWKYDIQYPQGTLHLYLTDQLTDWPGEMRLIAGGEQDDRLKQHEEQVDKLQNPDCGPGG
jgi:hypothetical protein